MTNIMTHDILELKRCLSYFKVLTKLRDVLEEKAIYLKCYHSSIYISSS